jgi:hypothetical protein
MLVEQNALPTSDSHLMRENFGRTQQRQFFA